MTTSGGRTTTWVLGGALAVSLLGHAIRPFGAAKRAPTTDAPREVSSTAPASAPPSDPSCEAKLARCRGQATQIALDAMKANGAPAQAAPKVDEPTPADASRAAQRDALCLRAQASLRDEWARGREAIVPALTHSLHDADEQKRDVRSVVDEMQKTLSLDASQTERLERDYGERRLALVAKAASSLDGDPPDLAAVLEDGKRVFAEEDAFVRSVAGEEGASKWRASQVEKRTTILALLSTMADKDWEDDIAW